MSLVAAASSSNGNMSGHVHKQLTRSLERIIEEAQLSGELKLSGRKLKDFPKAGKSSTSSKYNLQDTVFADLSKNRFMELPEEVTDLRFLEKLYLYHNAIRVIPDRVSMLQSLSYLDLSRNQLTILPREICRLPLQTLLVAYNRLEALPEELGRMSVLADLDAGCNEISSLPSRMGDLPQLRYLDIRSNLLVHIPTELTYLKLIKLDISSNRISILPNELRKMKSLVDLKLSDNPLTSPPAALCIRGRTHVFKYLERQAAKHERSYSGRIKRGPLEPRGHVTLDTRSHRRHNVGSGYSTGDGLDKRWSQELNSATIILQDNLAKQKLELNSSETGEELQKPILTTREITNALSSNAEKVLHGLSQKSNLVEPSLSIQTINALSAINGDEKRSLGHIQTYREYKEALKQQRANDGASIYRPKEQVTPPDNDSLVDGKTLSENNDSIIKQIINEDNFNRKSLQKALPSHTHQHNTSFLNGNCEMNCKNKKCYEQIYKKPSSPINTSNSVLPESCSLGHVSRLEKTTINYVEGTNRSSISPGSSRSLIWSTNFSQPYSFTMKREFERAKEEAELIEQLKNHIESRLKMTLPEDLASTLIDGVVLCHLANYVRPRSVASIHVPSPAVPKLTMARCRRNVDNFLEACRKIGVDENLLCCASDVLEGGRGIVRVAVTVAELLKFYQSRSPLHSTVSGTSAQPSTNN